MKILASVPLYNAPDLARRSVEALKEADVFLVANSQDDAILDLTKGYDCFKFATNAGCNPAWNKAMQYFLEGDWDWLALGSSDVILREGWAKILSRASQKSVYVPSYLGSLEDMAELAFPGEPISTLLTGGVMGAFMFLPRKAVKKVFPIPKELILWFGDEYIFTKLRNAGWEVRMLDHLFAYHFESTGISGNTEASKIIEQDKIAWSKIKL